MNEEPESDLSDLFKEKEQPTTPADDEFTQRVCREAERRARRLRVLTWTAMTIAIVALSLAAPTIVRTLWTLASMSQGAAASVHSDTSDSGSRD